MKQDPLALAFFGAALALLAALLLYVLLFKAPEAAAPARPGFVEQLQRFVAGLEDRLQDKPAAKVASASIAAGPALEPGRMWRYAVTVEPPVWRDITLTYQTQKEGNSIGVLTDFVHAGGKANFHLGIFAPGHSSHENTRFPGFFMYAAYLTQPLAIGQPVAFGWHWQGKSPRSVKRFEGQVMGWEDLQLPGGNLKAAKIEGTLTYREDGQFRGGAHETFWYAPKVSQIVKIVREGITPDESARRIVAELAEYR